MTEGSTRKDFITKKFAKPDLAYSPALGSIQALLFSWLQFSWDIVSHSVHPASSILTIITDSKGRIEGCFPLKFQAPVRLMSLRLKCCIDCPSHDEFQSNLRRASYQLSLRAKQWTRGTQCTWHNRWLHTCLLPLHRTKENISNRWEHFVTMAVTRTLLSWVWITLPNDK